MICDVFGQLLKGDSTECRLSIYLNYFLDISTKKFSFFLSSSDTFFWGEFSFIYFFFLDYINTLHLSEKSCILETLKLSTCANSNMDRS